MNTANDAFRGRIAVVTGAGSGLGREFARLGAAYGMRLALADIEVVALQTIESELRAGGADVLTRVLDVSKGEQVDTFADDIDARFGVPHLLFNNAGVGTAGLVWESSVADWQWTLGVNLWGVIHGLRAFVPRMLAAARDSDGFSAHVVNTASMAGLLVPPLSGPYNVSKHAVVALTETLFHDLSLVSTQVTCSVLCPHYVPTGIHRSQRNRPDRADARTARTTSQRVAQDLIERAVTRGASSAEQIAVATFDAVRERRFYIAPHEASLHSVRDRTQHIVAQRNPADPFAARPELRASLQQALAAGD